MPETRPLQPGDPARIGDYELLGRLGEGGQGVVYLGRRDDSQVAIKLLRADLTEDSAARERFVREAMAATRVARFCTAQVYEADVEGDRPYIVSEYVLGPSLYRLVQDEGPRQGADLERLAIGTATALVAIHQADIVHRDFKPHNVLIAPDGPRVIDFGIARALDVTSTISTKSIGTPAYMAPEQLLGQQITPAADLFAWGVTMVFAATGQPAFGQDTIPAVALRIVEGEPQLAGLPEELAGLVHDCLAKEPERRPAAKDLLMRLLGHAAPAGAPLPEAQTAVLAQGVNLAAEQTRPLDTGRTADRTAAVSTAPPAARGRRTALLAAAGAVALAGLVAVVAVLLMNRNSGSPPATPPPPVSSSTDTGGASQPAPVPPTTETSSEPPPDTSEPVTTTTTTTSEPPPTTSEPPPTTSEPPTTEPPPDPAES